MADKVFNVLFLCTGNSARSIMAEAVMNQLGQGRFRAYSAGSHPRGEVHPLTLRALHEQGYPVDGLSSKGWEVFSAADAPAMDFVPLRAQWILMWANIYMSFAKITIVLLLINWASYRPTISRKFRAD